ncbi:MAG: hypothetical protein Q4B70_19035, partial [Lachnospiraceae bacterium]|nr:hypothetical protein [Lachnospiraceae bacterium]
MSEQKSTRRWENTRDKKHQQLKNEYWISMDKTPLLGTDMGLGNMLPAMFFTAVIMILVRLHVYTNNMDTFVWEFRGDTLTDMFNWIKMSGIMFCTLWALGCVVYRLVKETMAIRKTLFYIPVGVYLLMVLMSFLFSDYKQIALWGAPNRFEGTLTLVAYMLMFLYIINTVNSERNVKQMLYCVSGVAAFLGVIGITQILGIDVFSSGVGKFLTISSKYRDVASISKTLDTMVSQTLYNPNYVSFYLTLLIPIAGMFFFYFTSKTNKDKNLGKWISLLLVTLLVLNMAGSRSSSGFLGLAVEVIVALVIFNRKILQWWKQIILLIVVAVVVCLLVPGFRSEFINTIQYVSGRDT